MKNMNSKFQKLSMLCIIILVLPTCTGCELWNKIKKIMSNHYGNASEVSIVVVPPWPLISDEDAEDTENIRKAFTFSGSIESALISGVTEFNKASSNTKITPKFYPKVEGIVAFYDHVVTELRKGTDQYDVYRDVVKIFRKDDITVQCLIYGVFEYSRYKEAYEMSLVYYNYREDNYATVTRVVPKAQGRAQEEALTAMMKELLNKVYE